MSGFGVVTFLLVAIGAFVPTALPHPTYETVNNGPRNSQVNWAWKPLKMGRQMAGGSLKNELIDEIANYITVEAEVNRKISEQVMSVVMDELDTQSVNVKMNKAENLVYNLVQDTQQAKALNLDDLKTEPINSPSVNKFIMSNLIDGKKLRFHGCYFNPVSCF